MNTPPTATPPLRRVDRVRFLVAAAPIYLFAILCWTVSPTSLGGNISLSYLVPFSFCLTLPVVGVSRTDFIRLAGRLKVEFASLRNAIAGNRQKPLSYCVETVI